MNVREIKDMIRKRIDDYILKANEVADIDYKLSEELNIKALALNDILNLMEEEQK